MSDPSYVKTSSAERKAAERARNRYLHVSVLVGMGEIEVDGVKIPVPTRTPKGKGATARKNPDIAKLIGKARAGV